MKKKCPHCDKEFETDRVTKKYCTKVCTNRARACRHYKAFKGGEGSPYSRNHGNKICEFCKKEFTPKDKTKKYCSMECSSSDRKKFLSIPECLEQASRKLDKKIGYVRVYCPMHPEANTWGYVYEHRLIMEGVIGRHLTKNEHIHHINGKRWDNRPENLQIMSPSDHSKLSFVGQINEEDE